MFKKSDAHKGFVESAADHFGSTAGDFSKFEKLLPSVMTNPKRVESFLCKEIEDSLPGEEKKKGVSILRLNIFREAYKWSMASIEDLADIARKAMLDYQVEVKMSDLIKLKNNVLINWMDKIAPKLQAISHQVDVQLSLNKITTSLMTIVVQYIPEEKRNEALMMIQKELTDLTAVAELEEIPDDIKRNVVSSSAENDAKELIS